MDFNTWSDNALRRYSALLKREVDAITFPELALTDAERRELERYRLGLVERIDDVPVSVNDEHFPITERAFVEQDGCASNITTLGPRPATDATDAPDTEPELPVPLPAPPPVAPRPKRPPAPALTAEDWDACGIYLVNGIPTTTYGDARGQQILGGEIPIEQAKREEQARRRTNLGRPGISSPYL